MKYFSVQITWGYYTRLQVRFSLLVTLQHCWIKMFLIIFVLKCMACMGVAAGILSLLTNMLQAGIHNRVCCKNAWGVEGLCSLYFFIQMVFIMCGTIRKSFKKDLQWNSQPDNMRVSSGKQSYNEWEQFLSKCGWVLLRIYVGGKVGYITGVQPCVLAVVMDNCYQTNVLCIFSSVRNVVDCWHYVPQMTFYIFVFFLGGGHCLLWLVNHCLFCVCISEGCGNCSSFVSISMLCSCRGLQLMVQYGCGQ